MEIVKLVRLAQSTADDVISFIGLHAGQPLAVDRSPHREMSFLLYLRIRKNDMRFRIHFLVPKSIPESVGQKIWNDRMEVQGEDAVFGPHESVGYASKSS